ncbi:MAG: hypothetical protein CMP67_05620 [Flavobacteriales bacterium]|nr:hypothetical protein [Flavobacteriales bacterium]
MNYNMIALNDDLEGGRKVVEVEIQSDIISFTLNEKEFSWPISDLEFQIGGASKGLIYIKNSNFSSIILYTRDKKILKNEFVVQHPNILKSSKKISGFYNQRKVFYSSLLLFLIALPIVFYAFRSSIIKSIANRVPVEWEIKAGNKLFETLKNQYDIIEDSSLSARFDTMFIPLVNAAGTPDIDYQFYLCSDPSLNAFALPGGHIVINLGTINKIERIEELYGVIGHEIAHVTQRHHLRGVISNLSTFLIFQGLLGDEAGLIGAIGESAGRLESLFYSRSFERESDEIGFNYMKEAHIDPKGMVEFFERIKREYEIDENLLVQEDEMVKDSTQFESTSLDKIKSFVSTHPNIDERIEYLNKRICDEMVSFESKDFELDKFQKYIQQKIK